MPPGWFVGRAVARWQASLGQPVQLGLRFLPGILDKGMVLRKLLRLEHRQGPVKGGDRPLQVLPAIACVAEAQGRREADTAHLEGRRLFSETANFGDLAARVAQGQAIKRTGLSEEFTMEDFRALYGEQALPMFCKSENGQLKIATADKPLDPGPGDTLISLVPAQQPTG